MSQVSAEVRAMAEALNSGDLEGFVARTAEDVEFTSLVAEAEGRTYRGHAGVRTWWETVLGAFQDPRWEVLDARGPGDRAVLKSRLTATLAETEVEAAPNVIPALGSNGQADRGVLVGVERRNTDADART